MSAAGGGGRARELLQMRFHFGERDRDGDAPLEAAVMDACARRGVAAAVTLRGVEGFGAKHQLRTDRLLTLSEDAPLVAIAVGEDEVVEAVAQDIEAMAGEGLVVTSSTGSTTTSAARAAEPVDAEGGLVKATVWGPRSGPDSPHLAAVAAFHAHGTLAAAVLLGVDGVLDGERRRARFVAANRGVPAITVATGERAAVEKALADLEVTPSLVTLEPVDRVARNSDIDRERRHGTPATRVTLVTSEIAMGERHPLYVELIHALRGEGAAGATALRGVWGFRGGREPHGDRVLALRRDVPVVVEVLDTAKRAARWLGLAESMAGEDDLVYSEEDQRTFTLG